MSTGVEGLPLVILLLLLFWFGGAWLVQLIGQWIVRRSDLQIDASSVAKGYGRSWSELLRKNEDSRGR